MVYHHSGKSKGKVQKLTGQSYRPDADEMVHQSHVCTEPARVRWRALLLLGSGSENIERGREKLKP